MKIIFDESGFPKYNKLLLEAVTYEEGILISKWYKQIIKDLNKLNTLNLIKRYKNENNKKVHCM